MNNQRLYEIKLPAIDEYVVGNIEKIENDKYHIMLLEYNTMAILSLNNYNRKMLKMIRKKLKKGSDYVFEVILVDTDRKYIDLSRIHVTDEIEKKVFENYKRVKKFNNIINRICDVYLNINQNIEQPTQIRKFINKKIVWPYYDKFEEPFQGIVEIENNYNKFVEYVKNALGDNNGENTLDNQLNNDRFVNILEDDIKKHFAPKNYKLRAEIELTCFDFEGVEAIKSSVAFAIDNIIHYDDNPLTITINRIPNYYIETHSYDFEHGDNLIKKFIDLIKENAKKNESDINIRLISETSVVSSSN